MEILVEALVELLSAIIIPVTFILSNLAVLLIQSIFYLILYLRNLSIHLRSNRAESPVELSLRNKEQSLTAPEKISTEPVKATKPQPSIPTMESVESVQSEKLADSAKRLTTVSRTVITSVPDKIKIKRRIFRRVMIWISGLALGGIFLLSLGLILANSFFFEAAVRLALKYVQSRSGIAITFESAKGNILRGRLNMKNVTVVRHQHPVHQMDLKAKEVFLDLSITDFRHRKFIFDKVIVSDMSGSWDQVGKGDKLKPRFKFRINDLEVIRAKFAYRNYSRSSNALKTIIQIEQARIQPLRSGWAICDLLFRSNMRGAVDSSPFQIESKGMNNSFLMNNIPVKLAAAVWDDPFEWFDKGIIDIHISNQYVETSATTHHNNHWNSKLKFQGKKNTSQSDISKTDPKNELSDIDGSITENIPKKIISEKTPENNYRINGQWSIVIRDFHVSAPKDANLQIRTISAPLLIYLNKKSDRLGLNFNFYLDDENFEFSSSESIKETIRLIVGQKVLEQLKTVKPNGK